MVVDFKASELDAEMVNWCSLDKIALTPEDYPEFLNHLTGAEFECQLMILKSLTYDKAGKFYSVALPFKSSDRPADHKKEAYTCTLSCLRKLGDRNPTFQKNWVAVFAQMRDWGFFEKVQAEDLDNPNVHYISTLPVAKPHKPLHPVRLVMQTKQLTENQLTLNDCLYQGETLLSNLTLTVIKF